ncbi:MAG TPA: hypothetical protein VFJ90_03375 [Candidatus Didemnitutus sp.]|nr:hypothetical protein [Candidatus Didemnitutus sp.]
MPGQQFQTTALLLARQPSGSDSFEQITAFSEEHGVLLCLARIPKASATARAAAKRSEGTLDVFDEAELWLESSNQGRTWFIKEHRRITHRPGLGRSYETLQAAARLATLILRNPVPDESRTAIAALLRQSVGALEQGARPDLVWLKALFCLLRDEGYPVKQQWWQQLTGADRDVAAQVLNQPLAGQATEPPAVARIVRRLEDWVRAETEIRL